MGGLSSERDVSMRSGLAIYQNLQEMGYNAVPIDVGKDIANVLKKEKVKLAYLALHGGMGIFPDIDLQQLEGGQEEAFYLLETLAADKIHQAAIYLP